jgi:uncharacterized protein YpiB (UPF0302 family)
MKKEEALQIIKALIDESIKKGVLQNIDTAIKISEAFNLLCSELIENK